MDFLFELDLRRFRKYHQNFAFICYPLFLGLLHLSNAYGKNILHVFEGTLCYNQKVIVFNYQLIMQVEALAVKLTQKEGELIQEKFEVKKLANFLKQVT